MRAKPKVHSAMLCALLHCLQDHPLFWLVARVFSAGSTKKPIAWYRRCKARVPGEGHKCPKPGPGCSALRGSVAGSELWTTRAL